MSMAMAGSFDDSDIIVTASKRMEALQEVPIAITATSEALGDLKLYRIPIPVTVAARSQKQVAFLNSGKVKGELVYRASVDEEPGDLEMLFRFKNRKLDGLGDPLPAGRVVVYQNSLWGRHLVGESTLRDKAVDEEVELIFGEPTNVNIDSDYTRDDKKPWATTEVTIANANPFAVRVELEFSTGGYRTFKALPGKLISKPGKKVWAMTIAPGSTYKLSYRSADTDDLKKK